MTAQTLDPAQPRDRLDPALVRTAAALVVGGLAVILDTTIVSVALDELGARLDASVDAIQWVSTAYLLALFTAIPVAGWAQNRVGGKRLWLGALVVFAGGSALCACAWNVQSLVAFRVVQGLGGGLMLPLMSTLLVQAAHGRDLGRLIAAVSLPAALGPIVGPVLGGVILHALSWPWLFLVNVPLCAVGVLLAVRHLPADGPTGRAPLDVVGLALVVPGVVAGVYGLSRVPAAGSFAHAQVLVPVVVGVALVVAFVVWALRRRAGALVDVALLRHRPLAASAVLLFLSGAALYGAMLLLPLYWQQVRGEDALGAGLLLIPQGVGALLSRSLAGRLTDRIGTRWVAAGGFVVTALGTLPFALAGEDTSRLTLLAALLVRGLGIGAVMIPLMGAGYLGLERHEVPDASIVMRIAQQLGGSFGVALLAVILAHSARGGAGSLAEAYDRSFWWAVGFTVVGVALSALLPAHRRIPDDAA